VNDTPKTPPSSGGLPSLSDANLQQQLREQSALIELLESEASTMANHMMVMAQRISALTEQRNRLSRDKRYG